MSYYNHYNLDEIAEQMNAQEEIYQTKFIDFPIFIQDISRNHLKVIFDGLPQNKSKILQHIDSIYSVGRTKFRHPNELSIFMEIPIFDFSYFHNKILEAIDNASNPNFSL